MNLIKFVKKNLLIQRGEGFKPLFEALSADEQLKWLNSQPKQKKMFCVATMKNFVKTS